MDYRLICFWYGNTVVIVKAPSIRAPKRMKESFCGVFFAGIERDTRYSYDACCDYNGIKCIRVRWTVRKLILQYVFGEWADCGNDCSHNIPIAYYKFVLYLAHTVRTFIGWNKFCFIRLVLKLDWRFLVVFFLLWFLSRCSSSHCSSARTLLFNFNFFPSLLWFWSAHTASVYEEQINTRSTTNKRYTSSTWMRGARIKEQ